MRFIQKALRRYFSPECLVKEKYRIGELPTARATYSELWHMAWPSICESMLVGLVGFIDTLMVSKCGTYAISAVGLTAQPRLIFYAFFFALNVGVTAIVSRRTGQKDRDGANECLGQALQVTVLLGLLLVTTAVLTARPLLEFAGAKSDTIEPAVEYFRITMIGLFFTGISLTVNAAQRGSGNTRIAMTTNLVANAVNCVFNYLLISGNVGFPALLVRGAAIATLLGNIVACVLSLASLYRKNGFLHFSRLKLFTVDIPLLKNLFRISSSAAVEQVFMRAGFFLYAKMVAELGTQAMATHQICMNIINLSFAAGDGLGIASSALVGQNLGKKRRDIARLFGKASQRVGLLIGFTLLIVFSAGGKSIISIFTDDSTIIRTGTYIMFMIAAVSPGQISRVIFNGCLRGAGDTKFVAISSLVSIALLRPLITYLLCYPCGFGVYGAWISLLIDQYLRLALSAMRFNGGKWSKIEV